MYQFNNSTTIIIVSCIILIIIYACKKNNVYQDSGDIIILESRITIPESHFGNIVGDFSIGPYSPSIAVDNSGNIYVADQGYNNIKVFSEAGNPIDTLGREGRGPDEYLRVSNLQIKEDTLFVYDSNLFRVSLYDTKNGFNFIESLLLEDTHPNYVWISPNGDYVGAYIPTMTSQNFNDELYVNARKISRNGGLPDQNLFSISSLQMVTQQTSSTGGFIAVKLPYGSQPIIHVKGDSVYYGNTNRSTIEVQSISQDTNKSIPLKIAPTRIPSQAMDSIISLYPDNLRQVVRNSNLPENYPFYNNFVVDDNYQIWICTNEVADDKNQYKWLVVSSNGNLLYTTYLDKSINLKIIKADKAYGIQTNENGLKSIVVFQINQTQNSPKISGLYE